MINYNQKISESQLKILFLLENELYLSNAKMARILRRHQSSTFRDLKNLMHMEWIERNIDREYMITQEGKKIIETQIAINPYYYELQKFTRKLKNSRYADRNE